MTLAKFIFGKNEAASGSGSSDEVAMTSPVRVSSESEEVAMTAPVRVSSEEVSMTSPVRVDQADESSTTKWMTFVMPVRTLYVFLHLYLTCET